MTLSAGARFGPYEIADEIGAGGMGVVYRATDIKLKREVAVKVLPESLATDEERLTRFQREAELLASLNHPNIAQIHGLEDADGATALVLELIEGPTLEDRIRQGALPPDEAIGIAMQIAAALEAAHGQSIVHRDLKPANIKVRTDGVVKVLDFGIAKALASDVMTSEPQSPIMTTPATQAGVILGTAAYMSPEQARGKQVDQRADIWAFGCVLYEMLTGQLAFGGEDVTVTLARIITNEANMESLPAAVSPAVRHAIGLCLRKDANKRIADIRDVRLALEGELESEASAGSLSAAAAPPTWRRVLPAAAAAMIAVLMTLLVAWSVRPTPESHPVNRFDYTIAEDQTFRNEGWRVLAVSPNGRQIVYNTEDGLYLRALGELEPRLIPGTEENLVVPSFSPNSQALAYATPGQIKRIAVSGGAPVVVTDTESVPLSLRWAEDGTILFSQEDGIYRVPANGGTPDLVVPASEDTYLSFPQLLPGRDLVLFSVATTSWDGAQIVVQSLSTGERTVLIEGGSDPYYLPTGHIVYALGNALFGVALDLEDLSLSGGAVPLVQGVERGGDVTGTANYGVAGDGTLVYLEGSLEDAKRSLVWVDREGRETSLGAPPRAYTYPRTAPDGSQIALELGDRERDIWTWDAARETLSRLTFDPGEDEFPVWSPDGLRIAYALSTSGQTVLNWQAADGTGPVEQLASDGGQLFPSTFLPDATGILLRTNSGSDDISIMQLDGNGQATPLLATAFEELNAEISPDGRWLAYISNESGSFEVYVRPFPDVDAGGRWQISAGGGRQPLWARDGSELFYRSSDAVVAVTVDTGSTFTAGTPVVLFEDQYYTAGSGRSYDISFDGEQFLMVKPLAGSTQGPKIIIVQNWLEEVARLVPNE